MSPCSMPPVRDRRWLSCAGRSRSSSAGTARSRASAQSYIVPLEFDSENKMAIRTIRIAMDGVTGRLGTNQHLIRSVLAIRLEGGLPLKNGDRLVPEPVLLGRSPEKLAALAAAHGGLNWSADTAA